MDSKTYRSKPNPKRNANIFSKSIFWWFRKFVWHSYKKGMKEEDLYDRLDEDGAYELGNRLERCWDKNVAQAKEKGTKPWFSKALLELFWVGTVATGLLMVMDFVVVRSIQPLLLGKMVEFFSPGSTITLDEEFGYTAGVVLLVLVRVFCWHHYSNETQLIGMRMRVACCSLIYRKVLRLSRQTSDNAATGYIVNLMTNDVSRFDRIILWGHFLWIPLLQLPIIAYLLYCYVGWSSIIGVAYVLLVTLPTNYIIGKLSSKVRAEVAVRTDERMKMMNEIVSGMRVIKMYGWEMPFAKLVAYTRKLEISKVSWTAYFRNAVLALKSFVDRSALFLTLLTYWLTGGIATADQVFAMTQLYFSLNISMGIVFPLATNFFGEAIVAVQRVQEFLLKPEVGELPQDDSMGCGEFSLQRFTASWDGCLPALRNFTLVVQQGQLCALVGQVGSGKSSVLQALLGELQPSSGTIGLHGRVSYASQEPWIFVGSVRDNILLGRPYRPKWYRKVVRACALEKDFQLLPDGDATMVGQKGASLSGGQRARVNLARAVYDEADIYLLDDPLSAVDTHVGKHLFEQCVCSLLAGKTRILVTHQIQHLQSADKIVVLNEGSIEEEGLFRELGKRGGTFSTLLLHEEQEKVSVSTPDSETNTLDTVAQKISRHSISKRSSTASSLCDEIRRSSCLSLSNQGVELSVLGIPASPSPPNVSDECAEEAVDSGALVRALGGYARASGGCFALFSITFVIVATQVICSFCDYWLAYWTSSEEARQRKEEDVPSTEWFVLVYGAVVACVVVISIGRTFGFVAMCMRASRRLHNTMFEHVLRSPIRFFDTNPSGRILNRFSKDIGSIDEILPFPILDGAQIFLHVIGIIVLILISQYITVIPLIVVTILFICLSVVVISTGRYIKHLEGVRRSPVFTHLSDTLAGLPTLRSSRVQEAVTEEFDGHQDRHTSTWILYLCNGAALGLWLDLISFIYVSLNAFSFPLLDSGSAAGPKAGLAVSQSLALCGMLQYGVLQLNEVVSQATSVERVLEYARLQPEPALDSEPGKEPPADWPSKGALKFKDVTLRYGQGTSPALKGISYSIQPSHKVGIVGRTGAGKSSLLAALFRLSPLEGSVVLDDLDTASVGLHDLRRRISIIPQEPVLFSASVRFNLDPFTEFSDHQLWAALEEVELKAVVGSLDAQVTEGGGNLSVGQRQLVCLARAILRNNKVLVLDEATANVDPETDALIQKTIRSKFRACTVLTIAHRLHTIMDSDQVLVMDAGQVAEFGAPHELLQRDDGVFTSLVRQTGPAMERQLRAVAQEAFMKAGVATEPKNEL